MFIILKVNEHEAKVLTGLDDYQAAARQLAEWGVKEVLLTLGSEGSIIYAEIVSIIFLPILQKR